MLGCFSFGGHLEVAIGRLVSSEKNLGLAYLEYENLLKTQNICFLESSTDNDFSHQIDWS